MSWIRIKGPYPPFLLSIRRPSACFMTWRRNHPPNAGRSSCPSANPRGSRPNRLVKSGGAHAVDFISICLSHMLTAHPGLSDRAIQPRRIQKLLALSYKKRDDRVEHLAGAWGCRSFHSTGTEESILTANHRVQRSSRVGNRIESILRESALNTQRLRCMAFSHVIQPFRPKKRFRFVFLAREPTSTR